MYEEYYPYIANYINNINPSLFTLISTICATISVVLSFVSIILAVISLVFSIRCRIIDKYTKCVKSLACEYPNFYKYLKDFIKTDMSSLDSNTHMKFYIELKKLNAVIDVFPKKLKIEFTNLNNIYTSFSKENDIKYLFDNHIKDKEVIECCIKIYKILYKYSSHI